MNRSVLSLIDKEMSNQESKWGLQSHHYDYWLGITMEELGEVAKAVIERRGTQEIKKEIVQTTAVLCSWLEHIERQEVRDGRREETGLVSSQGTES